MRVDRAENRWQSDSMRVGVIVAVAIHVVIIAGVLGSWHLRNFTAGDDAMDGSGDTAPLSGKPVNPNWKTHTVLVTSATGAPLDLARVHLLLGDSIKVTAGAGTAAFTVRAGTMFVVRVTRRGFEPLLLRLPNRQSEPTPDEIRMVAVIR